MTSVESVANIDKNMIKRGAKASTSEAFQCDERKMHPT